MLDKLLSVLFMATLPALASAQSFNIDSASVQATAPSSSYGAALGQVGYWNAVPHTTSAFALKDLAGQATNARITTHGCGSSILDDPAIVGGDAALLEDWDNGDCYADPMTVTISGLMAGTYIVTPYAYSVISPNANTMFELSVDATQATSLVVHGQVFTGFVGFPLPRATMTVAAGQPFNMRTFGQNYNGLAGLQLTLLEGIDTYCFGDLGDCPCGVGASGRGCPSSIQSSGAGLSGSGTPQISADGVALTVDGISASVVTFFHGTALVDGGRGTTFGDGLRCAGGSVIRIAAKLASGGICTYPEPGDLPISVKGALPQSGGLRTYQVWYRNAADYCTTSTFNLTNGLAIPWSP